MPFAFPLHRARAALIAAALLGTVQPALAAPQIAEIVVDARDGAVLYERQPDAAHRPASLTKMMTLYLAFDALAEGRLRLGDRIVISRHAARQPASRLGIAAGQSITVDTALSVIAVDSANDVAVALAEHIGGSEADFARMMTAKAGVLGLHDTRFANATGLTNRGNVTTARDIAALSIALLRQYPGRYSYFSKRSARWQSRRMTNHNHLLGKVAGVDGIKTGYTVDAGYNLAASAKRHGRRVIVVVLGARSVAARDLRVANLVELGFSSSQVVERGTERRPRSRRL